MDFDITPYTDMRNALLERGIKCGVNGRHQITVSVQNAAIWPDAGNSFWITHASQDWYLFTWAPVGYRIPDCTDIAESCCRCMAVGDCAMCRVPEDICDEFGLTEPNDNEAENTYTAMETAKEPISEPEPDLAGQFRFAQQRPLPAWLLQIPQTNPAGVALRGTNGDPAHWLGPPRWGKQTLRREFVDAGRYIWHWHGIDH